MNVRVLQLGATATQARCRAALQQAIALGLPEVEIRRLAKLPEWQLAPKPETKARKK